VLGRQKVPPNLGRKCLKIQNRSGDGARPAGDGERFSLDGDTICVDAARCLLDVARKARPIETKSLDDEPGKWGRATH
jgi:hypothetical protein